jgi:hypothetical protein
VHGIGKDLDQLFHVFFGLSGRTDPEKKNYLTFFKFGMFNIIFNKTENPKIEVYWHGKDTQISE